MTSSIATTSLGSRDDKTRQGTETQELPSRPIAPSPGSRDDKTRQGTETLPGNFFIFGFGRFQ